MAGCDRPRSAAPPDGRRAGSRITSPAWRPAALVRRMPCPTDNRGALVVMTPAGRRAIERAAPRHVEHVREAFIDALTPAQLDALTEISEAVLARLADQVADDG